MATYEYSPNTANTDGFDYPEPSPNKPEPQHATGPNPALILARKRLWERYQTYRANADWGYPVGRRPRR